MHLDPSGLRIAAYNGAIALVGPSLDFAKSYSPQPHITLSSASEYKSLGRPPLADIDISLDHVYVLGEGGKGDVRWLVVVWNHPDIWRRSRGLRKKGYHITLTRMDDHEVCKGIGSLQLDLEGLVAEVEKLGLDGMDHVVVACGELHIARAISDRMIVSYPESYKGFIRFAETMFDIDPKLAMLAYAQAVVIQPDFASKVAAKLGKMSELCSYGPTTTSSELERIPDSLRQYLVKPWPISTLRSSAIWTYPTTSRERQIYLGRELPRFFSYIYPGRIAGMSTPRNEGDIDTLASMGFTHVLTLTKETPLPSAWFEGKDMRNVYVPVENWKAPTLEEMDVIYGMIQDSGIWLIHCGGGVGRAGTVLACLITMIGLGTEEGEQLRLDAQTAITLLRKARPRSLESEVQERFVSSWVSHRWKRLNSTLAEEPYSTLQIQHANRNNLHDLSIPSVYFLIGKPGSGKSWLSSAIAKRRPRGKTIIISQDESGSRSMCETQLSREHPADVLVILDRCNPSKEDRQLWLGMTSRRVVGVYFDYSKELCRQRINSRLDHPTIRAGRGGNALDQMNRQNTPPELYEGFTSILTISSFTAAREAVRILTPDITPLKFPRTPHLLNLGATTDDDIVQDDFERLTGNLTVEEKIDGANMGISLSYDRSIRVQNRSHWVSSADHTQFKPLDKWVEAHVPALRAILDKDEQFPERYILYGEWVVAKHSIHYDNLPDRFLVFDLYDRYNDTFLSRSALTRRLAGKGLHQVPLLAETEIVTKKDVMAMLETKSAYSRERVEGVYIRFEDERRVRTVGRGKVVRGDFIAGNEHWSKGRITLNVLADLGMAYEMATSYTDPDFKELLTADISPQIRHIMKDENIHPHATGLAAKTVEAHQDKSDFVFWSGWFCPFNQRIWMALEERKIAYEYHEVNPYKKSKEFLKVNPLGLVPAIEHDKKALYESDVLIEYIEDLYPDSPEHPSIYPKGTFEKSYARLNVNHVGKKVIPNYFRLQQSQDASAQKEALEALYQGLRTLCERRKGPFFAGEQFTVVDMSIAPFVRRFNMLEKYRGFKHEDVGDGWVEWKDAMMNRESLKNTTSDEDKYEVLIMRYLNNEAESEVAKATRGGQHLP